MAWQIILNFAYAQKVIIPEISMKSEQNLQKYENPFYKVRGHSPE